MSKSLDLLSETYSISDVVYYKALSVNGGGALAGMLSSQERNKLRFLRLEQSNALELDIGVGGP